ncbi:hypothetical protein ACEWPL_006075 [Roseovarius sp. S1116L3]|uniref:hypothetical protein n=1 Tax=Roseovarius roseus TaxID=3342636 RepID=UPI003B67B8FE
MDEAVAVADQLREGCPCWTGYLPEAFEKIHALSGLIAAVGFLLAFARSHLF